MIIGNRTFDDRGKTYIMGILNVTPDSFSDGGRYNNTNRALFHAEQMLKDGADIIDVGGESARPGFEMVGDDEELKRVIPVISEIKKRFDVPVSVDTFHSRVAKESAEAGADMINDICGLDYAGNGISMAKVVKDTGVSVCIMHNNDNIYKAENADKYTIDNNINNIINDLKKSVNLAKEYGIEDDRIMIDPGVGFAKDYAMNMAVIANIERFFMLGYPILLGTSNKSVIGLALDLPIDERLFGTVATSVYAAGKGVQFLRVHDVKSNRQAALMAEKMLNYRL